MPNPPPVVRAECALALSVHPEHLLFEDITGYFAWIRRFQVYWAVVPDSAKSVVAALQGDSLVTILTAANGLAKLSGLMRSEIGALPGGLPAIQLANAVAKLTRSPRGLVGCRALLAPPFPEVKAWTNASKGTQSAMVQERMFRDHCKDPAYVYAAGGAQWQVAFSFFHARGGIERWVVTGDAQSITAADDRVVAGDGSLKWPFI